MPAFEVDESIEINAPLEQVKSHILDFKGWPEWSPWICAEPSCTVEHAADGKSYSWDGKIIGSGNMRVKRVEDRAIYHHLQFLKPFKSQSAVDFQLHPKGDNCTTLHWRMQSSLPFFMFFMVKKMQAFIAGDYRRGLLRLKDKIEHGEIPSKLAFPGVGEGISTAYFGIRKVSSIAEIGSITAQELPRVFRELEKRGEKMSGPVMTISHSYDPVADRLAYTLAVGVDKVLTGLGADFVSEQLEIPRSYKVVHTGAYRHLGSAWASGMMHEQAKVFAPNKRADKVEVYLNDPESTPESELITELHFPVR